MQHQHILRFFFFFIIRYKKVLQPLIDDLSKLESDEVIPVKTDSGVWILRAVLVDVLGDTLAIHDIYGLLGPSSNMFCRACHITRKDLLSGDFGDNFTPRTVESVQKALIDSEMGGTPSNMYGIKTGCALHELTYFRWPASLTFDPMHDLLEGVIPMVLKKCLQNFVYRNKTLTEHDINLMIENFEYGDTEVGDKPSSNFSKQNLRSKYNNLSQSAAQTWLLLRAFPFIFHKVLQSNPKYKEIISMLLRITYISFSNKLTESMIKDLSEAVSRFQNLFKECFPLTNAINKMHHIAHYSQVCRESGPVANCSCMMYEAKFKESKSQSKTCGNFKNLSYSLTKRLNLKQINSILKHNYVVDKPNIISSAVIAKDTIDTATLLFELPSKINVISHLKVNGVNFRPGNVVKYKKCSNNYYGILLATVAHDSDILFMIQELDLVEFDDQYFAYKVSVSQNIIRITFEKLLNRKSYSLWQIVDEFADKDCYYISLKYYDY